MAPKTQTIATTNNNAAVAAERQPATATDKAATAAQEAAKKAKAEAAAKAKADKATAKAQADEARKAHATKAHAEVARRGAELRGQCRCACGCGALVPRAVFVPGHDSRLASRVLAALVAGATDAEVRALVVAAVPAPTTAPVAG